MARLSKTQARPLTASFDDYMRASLTSPRNAYAYLKVSLEEFLKDGHLLALMLAIYRIAEANGGITALAQKTKLSRQNLYKLFSAKTTPRLDTVVLLLSALGYQFTLTPIRKPKAKK